MHRRPACNGNTDVQLIQPCSLCVNVINAVYSIGAWHHLNQISSSAADTPETPAFIEYAITSDING